MVTQKNDAKETGTQFDRKHIRVFAFAMAVCTVFYCVNRNQVCKKR